ncbi:MAG TPA: TolC family protein, partial [Treponema sp.]|nr:TolC family protein [Treponema sp.]
MLMNKNKWLRSPKKISVFLVLCFSMLSVFSEPLSIHLDEAVRLAFQNNVQLSSMAIDLRMKKAEKDYAWNVFLPNVQATGTMARSNLKEVSTMVPFPPFTETIVLEEKDKWKVMGGLNISLNLNAALFEGLRATRQSYEAGLLSYEAARRDTEQNVKKAFYGLLLQEGSLAISKEKLASAQKRKTQMEANFKNGLVSELQYLQVQLALETQKPAIMEAELLLAQQKELFAFLLGLPLGTEIVLVGEIAPHIQEFNADELIAEYLGRSFELAQLDKNKELMETQLRATLLQTYTPTIVLSQTFNPALGKIDDDWFKKDNWADTSGAFSLTIAFNLTNLLPFSGMGQNIQKTRDTIEKLELAKKQALHMSEID